MRVALAAAWLGMVTACGGRAGNVDPCANGAFVYSDQRCGLLPDGGAACTNVGDGSCLQRCADDRQCVSIDAKAPYCRTLGLFAGGDSSCNSSVRVCRGADHDDCPIH